MWTEGAELLTPHSLAEALRHKREAPEALPLAGGSWVTPRVHRGELAPRRLLDLGGVPQLVGVSAHEDGLHIGAMTRWQALIQHPRLGQEAPLLVEAARCVGGLAARNQGTLGGHVVAADPDGVALPALLALDAALEVASDTRGPRLVPLVDWLSLPPRLRLERDELLVSLRLPPAPPQARVHFRRVAGGWGPGAPRLLFASRLALRDGRLSEVRLAWGAIGPAAARTPLLERALEGQPPRPELAARVQAELLVSEETAPDAPYRRRVAVAVLRAWLEALVS